MFSIDFDDRWTNHRHCEDEDSSDEDFVPFIKRSTGIEQPHEISMDGAVLDVVVPDPPE